MIALVVEELELISALLLFVFASLTGPCLNSLNLALELDHFVLLFLLLGFQLLNLFLQVRLAVLRLQLLPHGESHRRLVQGLVRCNGHFDLISYSQEEQTALRQIQRHLTNDLVKALREEFLSDWADAALSGLALHKFLIEHLTQSCNVNSRCWLMTHILNEVLSCKIQIITQMLAVTQYTRELLKTERKLTIFNPAAWGQNSVQDVFLLWLAFHWRQSTSPL